MDSKKKTDVIFNHDAKKLDEAIDLTSEERHLLASIEEKRESHLKNFTKSQWIEEAILLVNDWRGVETGISQRDRDIAYVTFMLATF